MWCRRRRSRRRKPLGLERVPAIWWCRARHLASLRRPPLVKTRRGSKEALPPVRGGKKRKATPTGEAEGSRKRKTPPPDYSHDAEEGGKEWPDRTKRPAIS